VTHNPFFSILFLPSRLRSLTAWQPILTPRWAIITFVTIGVVFVAIGFGLKAAR
jgi:hypothetical protein